MEKLLVTGCRRSGTTLLASLLGAHSDINMLNEAYDKSVNKLVGKKYQGVKLGIPHIKLDKRTPPIIRILFYHKLAFLVGRLKKMGIKLDLLKGSSYSINDYINMDAKIVFVYRDKEENIKSMLRRSKISYKRAVWSVEKANEIMNSINCYKVSLEELTTNTKKTLEGICEYLGIEFEEKMLSASGLNNNYANTKIEPKK